MKSEDYNESDKTKGGRARGVLALIPVIGRVRGRKVSPRPSPSPTESQSSKVRRVHMN